MLKVNPDMFRILALVNIVLIWAAIGFIMNEGEDSHSIVNAHLSKLDSLEAERAKGKRNTYCDHLRHLVYYHNRAPSTLYECLDKPLTELQWNTAAEGF